MRFLVLQHSPLDHPGVMRRYLREDGIAWDAIDMHAGRTLPPLGGYEALIVMGGPQQTDQEAAHPWLAGEKEFIRRAILEDDKPVLGICLGAQLIAEATGGRVEPMRRPEIGVLDIERVVEPVARAAGDALLEGFPARAKTLQWHLNAVTGLPPGARHLMRSPACEVQAFRVGRAAYGLQFHMELTSEMVMGTEAFPQYVAALEAQQGPGALKRLAAETARHAGDLDRSARLIYDNFVALARADTGARRHRARA